MGALARAWTCVLWAWALAGCGGEDASSTIDAGRDPDMGTVLPPLPPPPVDVPEPTPPAPPEIPWLAQGEPSVEPAGPPVITPCPTGWREAASPAGVPFCDPWPEGGRRSCGPADEVQLPGEPGCRRIGPVCPDGDWADDLPADRPIVYVRADAEVGGDGTRERPFASIGAAMDVARTRGVVAVAKGVYAEQVDVRAGRELWGACAAETILLPPQPFDASDPRGAITFTGEDGAARNVSIRGSRLYALFTSGPTSAGTVANVVIERSATVVAAGGSRMSLTDVVVRDADRSGPAIVALSGATLTLGRTLVEDASGGRALLAQDEGTSVVVGDSVLAGTLASPAADTGLVRARAVQVARGASVTLERVVIEDGEDEGIRVQNAGSRLVANDLVVQRTVPPPAGSDGVAAGVAVLGGGQAEVHRASLLGNHQFNVSVQDAGSRALLADVLVVGGGGASPIGLRVLGEGALDLERVAVEGLAGRGVVVLGAGSRLGASDLAVRDVGPEGELLPENAGSLSALQVGGGASADVVRLEVARSVVGVLAHGAGSVLSLQDARLDDAGGPSVAALAVVVGASVTARRLAVNRPSNVGIAVVADPDDAPASMTLEDVSVVDCRAATPQELGRGIEVGYAAAVDATRTLVAGCRDVGLFASGPASVVRARDVVVRDIRPTGALFGNGVVATDGATLELERALVERTRAIGLSAQFEGTLVLTDVVVRDVSPSTEDAHGGWGVAAQVEAQVRGERVVVERTRELGVAAMRAGVLLSDVVVRDTEPASCATGSCAGSEGGMGVVAIGAGSVTFDRFAVEQAALCGVIVAESAEVFAGQEIFGPGQVDLRGGRIVRAPVGACVQVPSYDLSRLSNEVLYLDNGVNLDATSYEPPAPIELPR
ncbi:MAG: hypothetical protein IT379_04245 [Deltaproteobacteria bacterium]|nr:hypothetical protein [Deltaproteobacteria bacterium]